MNTMTVEPLPELVKLSNEYSNISVTIAYYPTPEEHKLLGNMDVKDFTNLLTRMAKAMNPNKSFKEALEFTITTRSVIKSLMDDKGINTVELGKRIGVSDVTVGRWLNGTSSITKNNLSKLADYFEVSTNYLCGIDGMPTKEDETIQLLNIENAKRELESFGITNLDKEILKECGYYLIDPYLNNEYYDEKAKHIPIVENQIINSKEWIKWIYSFTYFDSFPKKLALVKTSDFEEMGADYSDLNNPIGYSEEIKNIAQYVDYDKLKVLIEDRKNLLSFNFEKSLESIK